MRSGVSSQMSREKRGVDDVVSEKSCYMTVRDGSRNKCEKYCGMIFYSGARRRRNDMFFYIHISNFSPAAFIHLNFIFIPFWQIRTFLQIQLPLSSYFSSHSPCALSLSLLSCLLALQHTLVASLSLSTSLFLYLSFFLSISFSHIAFPSPPPSSVAALNVVHTQALNLKMPHTVSITRFQCDDSRPPGTKYSICHHLPLFSHSVCSLPLPFFVFDSFQSLRSSFYPQSASCIHPSRSKRRGEEWSMNARGRRGEKSERERGKTAQRLVKSKSERASLSLFTSVGVFTCECVRVSHISTGSVVVRVDTAGRGAGSAGRVMVCLD